MAAQVFTVVLGSRLMPLKYLLGREIVRVLAPLSHVAHQARLQKRHGNAESASKDSGPVPEPNTECDDVDDDDDGDVQFVEPKSTAVAASLTEGRASRMAMLQTPPSSSSKKPKLTRGASSTAISSCGASDAGKELTPDDNASSKAGSCMEKSSGKKQGLSGLPKHLNDIKLQAILDGYKPGVEIHQATLHLKKLEAADRVVLQAHIKHAEHCKTLSVHEIASVSKEEILQSMCALEKQNLVWPAHLKKRVWEKEAEEKATLVKSQMTDEAFDSFMECVRPYARAADEKKPFDFRAPVLRKVGASDIECTEKLHQDVAVQGLVALGV